MIAVTKTICILTCGFVLSVGLSQTTWAGDEMKSPRAASRIGGQSGQSYDQFTQHKDGSGQMKERLAARSGARIGGQAGRSYDHKKHEYEPTHANGRIGGEAGESYNSIQLE